MYSAVKYKYSQVTIILVDGYSMSKTSSCEDVRTAAPTVNEEQSKGCGSKSHEAVGMQMQALRAGSILVSMLKNINYSAKVLLYFGTVELGNPCTVRTCVFQNHWCRFSGFMYSR